ncbi:MAG: DNA-3-methyladenine glycosylase [Bacilli bacterium]
MRKRFEYGQEEMNYLKTKDPKLGIFIDKIGYLERFVDDNLYFSLVAAIVSQQISGKAADTVLERIKAVVGNVNPENIAQCSSDDLQKCGLSWRKVSYIKDFTNKIINEELNLNDLKIMTDEEIIRKLDALKGFGPWTAEMLLIFSLERKNILSFNDFAIQKGLRLLYHHRLITPILFHKYQKRYSPYATIASFYLWEIATKNFGLKDYQIKTNTKK